MRENIFIGQQSILCDWNFAFGEQGVNKSQNCKEKQTQDHKGMEAHHEEQDLWKMPFFHWQITLLGSNHLLVADKEPLVLVFSVPTWPV